MSIEQNQIDDQIPFNCHGKRYAIVKHLRSCRRCNHRRGRRRSDIITVSITVYNFFSKRYSNVRAILSWQAAKTCKWFSTLCVCVCVIEFELWFGLVGLRQNEHSMYPVHSCALMHKHFQRVSISHTNTADAR